MLGLLLNAPRKAKRALSLFYDTTAIALALYASICLRLGTVWVDIGQKEMASLGITLIVSLVAFIKLGLYRAILRYMAHQALISVIIGVCISGTVLAASSFFIKASIPRSVPFIYIFTALFFVGTPRLLIRSTVSLISRARKDIEENIIIYGAGYSGYQLANSIQNTHYKVIAFVDDNPKLKGTLLRGLPVHKPRNLAKLIKLHQITKVFLALGSASRTCRSQIIKSLEPLGIGIQTIPPIQDILSGKAKIEDIKDVEIEDLLGRDPIKPEPRLLHACITGKSVMVTGAGGSIGSELCRQIIRQRPSKLILFEISEASLYQIELELSKHIVKLPHSVELIPLIGSVQNQRLITTIMQTFDVQTVYHAAAYKHVPIVEQNIIEGVRNNVFGTWYCAEAAIKANVESFVLISTDKAVRSTNIMGASKRFAELVLQGLAQRQHKTRFTMVRFGNVLGSSGSVVPLFRQQIKTGGPVTVTHPDIIRYFMTIPEAAELVIQAGAMGRGGDVFVLDMGEPVKIVELAKRMIHLSGLEIKDENHQEGDIEIEFSGLRPGEKLFEELLIGDNVSGTQHPRILRAEEKLLTWQEMEKLLTKLEVACLGLQCNDVKAVLLEAPTDFVSKEGFVDPVWISNEHPQTTKPVDYSDSKIAELRT
ncbi:polysaccharide biosynthesis protein [Exilibacterium tricleocarpae]|uniref:Polysaccharide biosynthesis protein n=1 Tax=Exilibacterium tricleocarpae TaxID=2591008 RepID=A0A545U453_9GAMM|nr:nucleoside-diphosphate sugar epimerase/dehydratase [Exilibacterium tricleocarpae]TQV84238.1 polysaccharide biosynthesis protein [Exilibacterium tricleocarpae]